MIGRRNNGNVSQWCGFEELGKKNKSEKISGARECSRVGGMIILFLGITLGGINSCGKSENQSKKSPESQSQRFSENPSVGTSKKNGEKAGDFVVAIDVGHTIDNPGATSARGRKEFYFNRDIADMLHKELVSAGFKNSFIINSDGKIPSLRDRTRVAAEKNADLFISLHHDSAQLKYFSKWTFEGKDLIYSDKFRGFSLFVSQSGSHPAKSFKLAKNIAQEMSKKGFVPTYHHSEKIEGENRELLDSLGIYRFDGLAVLKTATMPAVLFECGVIVNRDEELKLQSPEAQKKIVGAVVEAVKRYLD